MNSTGFAGFVGLYYDLNFGYEIIHIAASCMFSVDP
jgi:hypothetical protein